MKFKLSAFAQFALYAQVIYGLLVLVLSLVSFFTPLTDHSEFAALHNFSISVFTILTILFTLALLVFSFIQFKVKKWAYITNLCIVLLLFPITAVSNLLGPTFEWSPGASLSLTKEIFPSLVILLQVLCIRNYFNSAKR